jgi:MerR family copper efflux transcriptional regulator
VKPAASRAAWPVNIGDAARLSGVSAKMVRHYESLGLLPRVTRTDSGYRQYSEAEVHTLRFIKRARDLGFSMEEIGELVSLWQNRRRASASVRRIAQKHAQDLAQRIAAMQEMQKTLGHLIHCCQGDARPECPILEHMSARG